MSADGYRVWIAEAFDADGERIGRIVHAEHRDALEDIETSFPDASRYDVSAEELHLGEWHGSGLGLEEILQDHGYVEA